MKYIICIDMVIVGKIHYHYNKNKYKITILIYMIKYMELKLNCLWDFIQIYWIDIHKDPIDTNHNILGKLNF